MEKYLNGWHTLDSNKIEEIWCERIPRWAAKLKFEHATPVILIGIGHDHESGQITVCVPENLTDFQIKAILSSALLNLDKEDPYR